MLNHRVKDRKRVTKNPSYRYAVEWIALNDEAGNGQESLNVETVSGYVSTLLVADLFGCDANLVAIDIVSKRRRIEIQNADL